VKDPNGVILLSGGFDSVALAIVLKKIGLDLQPVYMSHRANVGNVTKKEIQAASHAACEIFDRSLLIVKAKAKDKEPEWYQEFGNVAFSKRLPVPMSRKHLRNRVFLAVLGDLGLDFGVVAIGLLGTTERTPRNRIADEEHDLLKRKTKGRLVTPQDLFSKAIRDKDRTDRKHATKTALLCEIGKRGRWPEVMWGSQSCRLYFKRHDGNCNSCKERVLAFMDAWGEDRTDYRKGSWADRVRRGLLPPRLPPSEE
jgi:7-cyano-7-deazaguanine synthase in queuosine biosynthesis